MALWGRAAVLGLMNKTLQPKTEKEKKNRLSLRGGGAMTDLLLQRVLRFENTVTVFSDTALHTTFLYSDHFYSGVSNCFCFTFSVLRLVFQ